MSHEQKIRALTADLIDWSLSGAYTKTRISEIGGFTRATLHKVSIADKPNCNMGTLFGIAKARDQFEREQEDMEKDMNRENTE